MERLLPFYPLRDGDICGTRSVILTMCELTTSFILNWIRNEYLADAIDFDLEIIHSNFNKDVVFDECRITIWTTSEIYSDTISHAYYAQLLGKWVAHANKWSRVIVVNSVVIDFCNTRSRSRFLRN